MNVQPPQESGLVRSILQSLHLFAEKRLAKRVAQAVTTDDLWLMMRRRVPPIASEYFRGGAEPEVTLIENVLAFRQARITAYGARKFSRLDLKTNIVGQKLDVPWFVAPVGSLRTLYPLADALAARVAGEFGTTMALSTLSGTPMELVRQSSVRDCWFQLYLCGGRDAALRGIERAKRAGFSALILTIDTGLAGNRAVHARMRPMEVMRSYSGLSISKALSLLLTQAKLTPQMITRLPWLISHWSDGGMYKFVNVLMDELGTPMPYADIGRQLAESAVTWDDISWVKQAWGDAPLIIKGVHNAEDAKRAEDLGANGVIWSNHGARQKTHVLPTLHIVAEEMPKMAGSRLDFMMDGGIRCGSDGLIALTYGLKGFGLGRVCAAGLGAGGYAGMRRAFEIFDSEFRREMALVGFDTVEQIRQNGPKIRRDNKIAGSAHLPNIVF
jgi:L-lactate dehydrogenase (cytochrome)